MAIIGLSLSDTHLAHVSGMQTARQMWKAILDIFERHTLLNKLSARRTFYTASIKEDESVVSFITRVRYMASTLKSMSVTIDDAEMAMAVLNGLPDLFDNLISALDALRNEHERFTLDFVKSRVLKEEQRMKMRTDGAIVKALQMPYWPRKPAEVVFVPSAITAESSAILPNVAIRGCRISFRPIGGRKRVRAIECCPSIQCSRCHRVR